MSSEYLDYLESPEWWRTRKAALARADYHCERCGSLTSLEVHHRTYHRLGDENDDDLEVLCSCCHRAEHLPRNRRLRTLEQYGQQRLFDRWEIPHHLPLAA